MVTNEIGSEEKSEAAIVREFGDPKPIPEAAYKCKPYVQHAARMYIHDSLPLDKIAKALSLTSRQYDHLCVTKKKQDWSGFMAKVSSAVSPSVLLKIEAHDLKEIKKEKNRRAKLLPLYEKEERRLIQILPQLDPGSRQYKEVAAALEKVQNTIREYSGIGAFEDEQATARKALMKKQIDMLGRNSGGGREQPGTVDPSLLLDLSAVDAE